MANDIHLTSFRSLAELEVGLALFGGRMSSILDDVERRISNKRDQLEQIIDDRKRVVADWQDAYDSADPEEDDISSILRRLEEARDNLEDAQQWQRKIDDAYLSYARKAQQGMYLCTDHTGKARAALSKKISELHEYAAFRLESVQGSVSPHSGPSISTAASLPEAADFTLVSESTGQSAGLHEQNHRAFQADFAARRLTFKHIGRAYVDLSSIRGVENEDWNENDERFWSHHGNTREFYESMAAVYPSLRQIIIDEHKLETLRDDPKLQVAVNFWWSKSDPIKITKFRDSYFVEQGHHRISLAKRYGFEDVPCDITEAAPKSVSQV